MSVFEGCRSQVPVCVAAMATQSMLSLESGGPPSDATSLEARNKRPRSASNVDPSVASRCDIRVEIVGLSSGHEVVWSRSSWSPSLILRHSSISPHTDMYPLYFADGSQWPTDQTCGDLGLSASFYLSSAVSGLCC